MFEAGICITIAAIIAIIAIAIMLFTTKCERYQVNLTNMDDFVGQIREIHVSMSPKMRKNQIVNIDVQNNNIATIYVKSR